MALRAVIFDMDGVLCTTTEYHYRSWKAMAQKYGIPFTQADNDKLRGLSRRHSLDVLLGNRDVTEAQAQTMMDHKNEIYLQLIEEISAANLLPGAHALLRQLKEAGVPAAVASSSQHARAVLQKLGITDYVKAVSDGNSVQKSKPAPDTFLHAASLLGG
jgi:kojibiose phosphorylase